MSGSGDHQAAEDDNDRWEERFTGEDPRLSEVAEMYRELGFDVRIEPIRFCDEGVCRECFKDSKVPISVVYVRKPG